MTTYSRESYIRNSIINIELDKNFKHDHRDIYNKSIPKNIINLNLTPLEINLVNNIKKKIFKNSYNKLHPRLIEPIIRKYKDNNIFNNTLIWNNDKQGVFIQINIKYNNLSRELIITLFRSSPYLLTYIDKKSAIMPKGRYLNVELF